jgi:hypothetical protein
MPTRPSVRRATGTSKPGEEASSGRRRSPIREAEYLAANRIVGPGNGYVAAAKKLLAGEIGIDLIGDILYSSIGCPPLAIFDTPLWNSSPNDDIYATDNIYVILCI